MNVEYTMVRQDMMTNAKVINQIKINKITVEEYSQYPKSLKLEYINKGERKIRTVRFVRDKIDFHKGWDNPTAENLDFSFINGFEGILKNNK